MKFKHLLIFFLLGVVLIMAGAFFRLMHWPGGQFMLFSALLFQAFAIIMLIVKLIKNKDARNFLNK